MQYAAETKETALPIVGFWQPEGEYACFSNWYPAEFDYARKHYTSIEQYMMYQKVIMFRQYDLADQIMQTDDPATCKKLGRTKFPEFDSAMWDKTRKTIVKRGVKAKFRQNADMLATLLGTGGALLAECSPYDDIWGIGIGADDPEWRNTERWRGRNLLGRILMEVREELGRELAASPDDSVAIDASYYETEIPQWTMRAGELNRIPQYHDAIHAYSDTLRTHAEKNGFYYGFTLAGCEYLMDTNMGGGLPVVGFYEMKQDVYDIAWHLRLNRNLT